MTEAGINSCTYSLCRPGLTLVRYNARTPLTPLAFLVFRVAFGGFTLGLGGHARACENKH